MAFDVEQLRWYSRYCMHCAGCQELMQEAADEIERLRAEVAELRRLSANGPRQFASEECHEHRPI
jgi:hypothetical protein